MYSCPVSGLIELAGVLSRINLFGIGLQQKTHRIMLMGGGVLISLVTRALFHRDFWNMLTLKPGMVLSALFTTSIESALDRATIDV